MRHISIRIHLATQLRFTLADQSALPITLYDYQKEDLELFVAWLENHTARQRCYFPEATGLGKTVEFCTIIAAATGLKILVIESSKQLVIQTIRDIAEFIDGPIAHGSSVKNIITRDGDEIAHWRDSKSHDVLVVTDEALKLSAEKIRAEFNPDIIIWDESHWGYTKLAQEALKKFPEALIVAFTATPDYLGTVCKPDFIPVTLDNGLTLYADPNRMARTHFGDLIKERTVRWGIENRRLAPLAWGRIDFGFSLKDVPVIDGPAGFDYLESDLHKVLSQNWDLVIWTVVKLYLSNQYGLKGLLVKAMCPSIDAAETLTTALQGIGIKAACITNKTKDDERARILAEAEAGTLQFLASVFALREGVNIKRAAVAMMLRPTRSRVLYIQFMGRVLRLFGDKVALVLDPFYTDTKFAPLSAPVLFGRPGQVVEDGDILIGPPRRRKSKDLSPYRALIAKAQPKIVVERLEIEYWAGEDGFFEADGERWGTLGVFSKLFGLSRTALQRRSTSCRSREGRSQAAGPCATFYALSDMKEACKDLFEAVPQTGNDGFFEADGERWGTATAFGRVLGISATTVGTRAQASRARKSKNSAGQINDFFPESHIKEVCADLLQELFRANAEGFFEEKGEKWGTIAAWSKVLPISGPAIRSRVKSFPSKQARDYCGHPRTFYAYSVIKEACDDLLEELFRANAEGFFEEKGEKWGTVEAFARDLDLHKGVLKIRLQGLMSKKGRSSIGTICEFYSYSQVQRATADLFEELPQAGPDGFFEEKGERWGTVTALIRLFQQGEKTIGADTIAPRVASIQSRKARDQKGIRRLFYPLSEAKRACADLFPDVPLPTAGKDGFFMEKGERWGTVLAFCRVLKLSSVAITTRLDPSFSRRGKSVLGRGCNFYLESYVLKACDDLLKKRSSSAAHPADE